jgi:hypothetical protein
VFLLLGSVELDVSYFLQTYPLGFTFLVSRRGHKDHMKLTTAMSWVWTRDVQFNNIGIASWARPWHKAVLLWQLFWIKYVTLLPFKKRLNNVIIERHIWRQRVKYLSEKLWIQSTCSTPNLSLRDLIQTKYHSCSISTPSDTFEINLFFSLNCCLSF